MPHDPTPAPATPSDTPPTPGSKTGTLSPEYVLLLAASLLAAPLFSRFVLRNVHDALAGELEVAVMVTGIAALVLPAAYTGVLLLLSRRLDGLAHGFLLPLVLVCLGALAALTMAQGVVLLLTAYELGANLDLTIWMDLAGLMLIGSGILALPGLVMFGTVPPLECTGIVVTDELPQLRARVQRVAALLGIAAPPRIIVGLEPRCFAAAAPVALRGGDLCPAEETVYLPLLALRVLTDAELDAVIGHELAHFRGGDVYFRQRFFPAMHTLRLKELITLPRIALACMLLFAGLLSTGISQQRELAADRAAAQAANPAAVIAAIFKVGVLGAAWRAWPQLDPDRPAIQHIAANHPESLQHSNLIERQLDIAQTLLARYNSRVNRDALREWLFEARLAHPLDTHPTNSQRAAALGVDMDAVLDGVLRDINHPTETERCSYLEQEITFLELQFGAQGEGEERGGPPREVISS
jgi:Zn-dependent protease with chaperone function